MTMHTQINPADRTLLPRGLIARRRSVALPVTQAITMADRSGRRPRRVYRAAWKFRIGADVQFGSEMKARVLWRRRTARGLELYDIEVIGDAYGRPLRTVMAGALEPLNG
ncbi:hypothetical protein GGD56_002429 [Rhizobium mongolense]|uniref:Uncharacterized protein n=2 Tax=Rhizobium mongolense TaxID=57676 RepID=A0ABR6IL55_9HYPH|nr:hypothetical protein [Rhizobium mongolense]MBB4228587.1 hypothetical protein [Rhizobium mongolense]TVZ63812.1 hypothetical protein BCL32_3987 [Rhizobium mongolense USDA 1844]